MRNKVLKGDNIITMQSIPDKYVHCIVTSPPYFGLRNYGIPPTQWPDITFKPMEYLPEITIPAMECCLGLEENPVEFVAHMVHVFRECKRLLRDDGTLWLNLGDSYAGGGGASGHTVDTKNMGANTSDYGAVKTGGKKFGLKQKDLMGIPWMVAFALRADGWYLRQDIIWHKPNPMPESVTDRCTKAHEYVFLLSKSSKYYFDAESIKEPAAYDGRKDTVMKGSEKYNNHIMPNGLPQTIASGGHERWKKNEQGDFVRNKRIVWNVASQPTKEAHFATFPELLVEDMIKSSTSEYGVCSKCGCGYKRKFTKELLPTHKASYNTVADKRDFLSDGNDQGSNRVKDGHKPGHINKIETIGWLPTCQCNEMVTPAIVFDPYGGSGTTGIVSEKLNRSFLLCEINEGYVKIQEKRRLNAIGLFQC